MRSDRTVPVAMTPRVGLVPSRGLITRRPGASGPVPVLIGSVLILIGILVFVRALSTDRVTFEFDAPTVAKMWNAEASDAGRPLLTISDPRPAVEEPNGDLVFGHQWSDTFRLRGRVDPDSDLVVELSIIGNREMDGGELMVDAMDLLVRVTEPDLSQSERLLTLQELGLVGGDPAADLAASRGDTDFVVAADPSAGNIGMSAAPRGSSADQP